jgi:hypothetical protein
MWWFIRSFVVVVVVVVVVNVCCGMFKDVAGCRINLMTHSI